jgi:hypothetical protein
MPELGCSHGGGVGMSGIWRCLGKHRVTWDLASSSPVQVGLLPDHEAVELHVMDLEAGKSSQRRPRIWSWLRPPFGLADIPIRARDMRRIGLQPHCNPPFLACITRPGPLCWSRLEPATQRNASRLEPATQRNASRLEPATQ